MTKDAPRYIEYATDFRLFASDLAIPAAQGPARFGDVMADFQRKRFDTLAPALQAVMAGTRPQPSRHWWEATKGASKDCDLAVALAWLVGFSRRTLFCQVGAADQGQADELRKAIRDLIRLNPWLSRLLETRATRILNPRTESVLEIIPADRPGSHGARPDVLVINELVHHRDQEFAENLMDNAAKVSTGLAVVVSNAGFQPSWQWDWRENARQSDRWHFDRVSVPAPWLDPDDVDEAKRRNAPARYARLWQGVWASGGGDALDSDWIDRATVHAGPMSKPAFGWRFAAGLDLGLKHDATALVVIAKHVGGTERVEGKKRVVVPDIVAHLIDAGLTDEPPDEVEYKETPGTGKLRLAYCRLWRPEGKEIDLSAVESELLAIDRQFRLAGTWVDKWQAAHLLQRVRQCGVSATGVDFTGTSMMTMATEILTAFRESRIELYPQPDLLADLRELRLKETNRGTRIESPRSTRGHGDAATAFVLALYGLKGIHRSGPPRVRRPLVCS